MKTEQNTVSKILYDLRNQNQSTLTCSKIENINVTNTSVKLKPPTNTIYVVLQVQDGGASDSTKVLRLSECSTIPASTTLGILLGALDIYDVHSSNNINGLSLCSVDNVTNNITVQYYTFS